MKLNNKSHWNTSDLRKLCKRVIKETGSHKDHVINIVTRKSRFYNKESFGGRAWLNGRELTMTVPNVINQPQKVIGIDGKDNLLSIKRPLDNIIFNCVRFAQVLEHEIAHNLGLAKHRDMIFSTDKKCEYAKDYSVSPQQKKIAEKRNIVNERYQKAINNLKNSETKLKRATNLVKKWTTKVNYYKKKYEVIK